MFSSNQAEVNFQGSLKHDLTEKWARPISGVERRTIQKQFQHGQKPYRYYLKKFQEIPDEVKIAGNLSSVGSSPEVIRRISTEAKKQNALHPYEWTSLCQMADTIPIQKDKKKVSGFIHHVSIMPSYVIYWNDSSIRLWHQLAKNNTVYWDATGSIITSRPQENRYLYYELALANPNTKEASIPVSSMISSNHDTPQIHYWLSKFRLQEKQMFGHANAAVPRQINSDRSLVFMQSALTEFCGETLDTFRTRAWRIISGKATESDKKKTIPHGCLSHTMKNSKDLCRVHYKSNIEYGMYLFSVLVNVDDLKTATDTLKSVLFVLMSKYITPQVQAAAEYIDQRIQALPDGSVLSKEVGNVEVEEIISSRDPNPNIFTEEEFILRRKGNEFSVWAEKLKEDVLRDLPHDNLDFPKNTRYSNDLAQAILKRYISFFPIWSNILLGDLKRHEGCGSSENETNKNKRKTRERKTNAVMEQRQRFRVLKDIYFSGQRFSRLDVFSKELADHFESVQKLVVLSHLKPRHRALGKATETVEEGWNKKSPIDLSAMDTGKYQNKPSPGR